MKHLVAAVICAAMAIPSSAFSMDEKEMLQFLREHSEELVDIIQEGHAKKRLSMMRKGWEHPRMLHATLTGRPFYGPEDAFPLTLFTDFACGHCKKQHFVLKKLTGKDGPLYDKIRVVFKAAPFGNNGAGSLPAAIFYAAWRADPMKAWKLADAFFDEQEAMLSGKAFETAERLLAASGYSDPQAVIEAARKGMEKDGVIRRLMEEDVAEAEKNGIEGTPASYMGVLAIPGMADEKLIMEAYEKATKKGK